MRFNNSPFITKKNIKNWENYKKQILNNINVKKYLPDNRNFWKAIKPCFSNKGLNSNKTLLKEKGNLISDEKELATIMTTFLLILQ